MPNIEDLIRRAMQEGKFDNLPGKGKKIHLEDANPHADPDWELAYGLIKDAGYSLPWIDTRNEIEKDIASARKDLRQAWGLYKIDDTQTKPSSDALPEWQRAQQAFRAKLVELNKRIRDYNLRVPTLHFQRQALNFELELQKITTG